MTGMNILYWHWWVIGLGLLSLEMLLPTEYVLVWMGISGIVTGLLAWLLPLNAQTELVLFGVLSIVSYFTYRRLRPSIDSDKPTLNRRGQSYVGRVFTLDEPIVNGIGKVHVDDSQWRISGLDTPAGAQVRVIAADGTTLKVEQAH
jgi:membrane protein implicated in regulation of membrane protease activity